ncbi:MAG: glycosyltransferase family 39 protein [Planctomycetota bacterium]
MVAATAEPVAEESQPHVVPAGQASRRSLIAGLVGLGVALRLLHYVWNHTIWYDESVLLFNVLDKGFLRLLGPLDFEVAAPPLYLWSLRASWLLCGDHAYVWRLPPLLIGCLTLALLAGLAVKTLNAGPAALFVALVAFSDAFVVLGSTIKPYILDAFFASAILYAFIATQNWPTRRRMLLFAAAAPLLISFSYPMIFLYAGLALGFLPAMLDRRTRSWIGALALLATTSATFVVLALGPMHAQRVPVLVAGWMNKFPDWSRPASVPGWTLGNTALVFHYCFNPVGVGCLLLTGVGAWSCFKKGRGDWVGLCLGPVAACFAAACVHAYPYSNNRLMLFAAPGLGFMTVLGVDALVQRFGAQRPFLMPLLAFLLIVPEIALCGLRIHTPWVRPDAVGMTRYVNQHREADDLVASDEANYCYFFFGTLRYVADADETLRPERPGQRVWFLQDYPEIRPAAIRAQHFPATLWECREGTSFFRGQVWLFVAKN